MWSGQTCFGFPDLTRLSRFHFYKFFLPRLGVGCLGDKSEQNTSAVSNSPKTSKSHGKGSEKKSNDCKILRISSICSHFLPKLHAKCHPMALKNPNNEKRNVHAMDIFCDITHMRITFFSSIFLYFIATLSAVNPNTIYILSFLLSTSLLAASCY